MEASFVDISEKISRAGYCETVFSQFTEMERYFLMSEMRPSEERDLPAYEAHPYRSFGGGDTLGLSPSPSYREAHCRET